LSTPLSSNQSGYLKKKLKKKKRLTFTERAESGRWQRMTTSEGISERAHHSLVAYGDHLYSFAGCNIFHFCFNDLFVYNLGAYLLSLAYVVS
jgi:hypothetical protein